MGSYRILDYPCVKESLREICLDVISETMTSVAREEIQTLGLPHSLEENLCELMAKL